MSKDRVIRDMSVEDLLELEYDCILRRRKGAFVVCCPDLSLVGSGPDVEQAWAALEQEKRRLFSRMTEAGFRIPPPKATAIEPSPEMRPPPGRRPLGHTLAASLVATSVAAGVLALVVLAVAALGLRWAEGLPSRVLEQASRVAEAVETMPDGVQEHLAARVGRLSDRLEPIAVQARPLVRALTGPGDGVLPHQTPDRSGEAQSRSGG